MDGENKENVERVMSGGSGDSTMAAAGSGPGAVNNNIKRWGTDGSGGGSGPGAAPVTVEVLAGPIDLSLGKRGEEVGTSDVNPNSRWLRKSLSADEEEEVFFGDVTNKEVNKISKFKARKTIVYVPGFRLDRRLMRYSMAPSALGCLSEEDSGNLSGGETLAVEEMESGTTSSMTHEPSLCGGCEVPVDVGGGDYDGKLEPPVELDVGSEGCDGTLEPHEDVGNAGCDSALEPSVDNGSEGCDSTHEPPVDVGSAGCDGTLEPSVDVESAGCDGTLEPHEDVGSVGCDGTLEPHEDVGSVGCDGTLEPPVDVGSAGCDGTLEPHEDVGNAGCDSTLEPSVDVGSEGCEGTLEPPVDVESAGCDGTLEPPVDVGSAGCDGTLEPPVDVGSAGCDGTLEPPVDVGNAGCDGKLELPVDVESAACDGTLEPPVDVESARCDGKLELPVDVGSAGCDGTLEPHEHVGSGGCDSTQEDLQSCEAGQTDSVVGLATDFHKLCALTKLEDKGPSSLPTPQEIQKAEKTKDSKSVEVLMKDAEDILAEMAHGREGKIAAAAGETLPELDLNDVMVVLNDSEKDHISASAHTGFVNGVAPVSSCPQTSHITKSDSRDVTTVFASPLKLTTAMSPNQHARVTFQALPEIVTKIGATRTVASISTPISSVGTPDSSRRRRYKSIYATLPEDTIEIDTQVVPDVPGERFREAFGRLHLEASTDQKVDLDDSLVSGTWVFSALDLPGTPTEKRGRDKSIGTASPCTGQGQGQVSVGLSSTGPDQCLEEKLPGTSPSELLSGTDCSPSVVFKEHNFSPILEVRCPLGLEAIQVPDKALDFEEDSKCPSGPASRTSHACTEVIEPQVDIPWSKHSPQEENLVSETECLKVESDWSQSLGSGVVMNRQARHREVRSPKGRTLGVPRTPPKKVVGQPNVHKFHTSLSKASAARSLFHKGCSHSSPRSAALAQGGIGCQFVPKSSTTPKLTTSNMSTPTGKPLTPSCQSSSGRSKTPVLSRTTGVSTGRPIKLRPATPVKSKPPTPVKIKPATGVSTGRPIKLRPATPVKSKPPTPVKIKPATPHKPKSSTPKSKLGSQKSFTPRNTAVSLEVQRPLGTPANSFGAHRKMRIGSTPTPKRTGTPKQHDAARPFGKPSFLLGKDPRVMNHLSSKPLRSALTYGKTNTISTLVSKTEFQSGRPGATAGGIQDNLELLPPNPEARNIATGTVEEREPSEYLTEREPCSLEPVLTAADEPLVYLYGTPRYPASTCREENVELYSEPPPKLDLFDEAESAESSAEVQSREMSPRLSMEDVLERKRQQLMTLRAEKRKMQEKFSKQSSPLVKTVRPNYHLMVPSGDSSPKMTSREAQVLGLNNKELEAVTQIHTLCNSQRSAKVVRKGHATVARQAPFSPRVPHRLSWNKNLVQEDDDEGMENPLQPPGFLPRCTKPILHKRQPGFIYPYSNEPASPVVVLRSRNSNQSNRSPRID